MDISFWAATDVGRTRDHNEDNFLVDKKLNLFIVADGMGGHAAGEVASSVAVREVRRVVAENRELIEAYIADESAANRDKILSLCESAVEVACARVFQLAVEDPSRKGMGTTLSLLLVAGHRGFIGHVGDSRIYLVRRSGIHQITEDHSLLNELIKRGRLKPGDAFDSPYKNAVTRAVGVYESVEVDAFDIDVLPGDSFLLCSDGLSCYLDDDVTRNFMSNETLKEIPDNFIRFANQKGGKDNITAIVVRANAQQDHGRLSERVTLVNRKTVALQAQPLFRYLDYRDIVKLMNAADRRRLEKGDVLVKEGSRSGDLSIVLTGRLSMSRGGHPLGEIGPDDAVGESVLISNAPHEFTVTALEASEVLSIRRERLHTLMADKADIGWKLLWSLSQILHIRLRAVDAELWRAGDSIEQLGRFAPSVDVEKPHLGASVMGVASLPVHVVDELVPPFVDGAAGGETKPFGLSAVSDEDDVEEVHELEEVDDDDDDDDGPLDSLQPMDDVKGAAFAIQNTEPDLRAKDLFDRSRLGAHQSEHIEPSDE